MLASRLDWFVRENCICVKRLSMAMSFALNCHFFIFCAGAEWLVYLKEALLRVIIGNMRLGVFFFSAGVSASMRNWMFSVPVESAYRLAKRLSASIFSTYISPFSSDKMFILASILSIESIFSFDKSPAYTDWRLSLLKNLRETCPISNLAPVDSSKYSVNWWII